MVKVEIGLRQAKQLHNMSQDARICFIAEGLPIILESANGFWAAAQKLPKNPRESNVLSGYAQEEAAKILILLDLVRCPPKLASKYVKNTVKCFYNHLARLLYADASHWRPTNIEELRSYVDSNRKAHYLEGYAGEYIVPNWNVALRESQLYADVEMLENGDSQWHAPIGYGDLANGFVPAVLMVVNALSALGVFSVSGLVGAAEIFGQISFADNVSASEHDKLIDALLSRLNSENTIPASATQKNLTTAYHGWQLPMYDFDFKLIGVPIDELERERNALMSSELW